MKPTEHTQLGGFDKYLRPVSYAALAGVLTTGALLIVFALVMTMHGLPQSAVDPIGVGSAVLGTFVSGFVCGRITRHKALVYGAICGVIMFLLYAFVNLTIRGQGFGTLALIRLIMFVPSSMLGAYFGVNRKKKRRP